MFHSIFIPILFLDLVKDDLDNVLDRWDDDDDEFKVPSKGLYIYQQGEYVCQNCDYIVYTKDDMEKHCLDQHAEDPEDENLEEGDEEIEPISDSEPGMWNILGNIDLGPLRAI